MSVIAVGIVVSTIGAAFGSLYMCWWLSGRVNKLQKENATLKTEIDILWKHVKHNR